MKKIDQQCFIENGEVGDCVRACTASILDMESNDVPHFVKDQPGTDWYFTWEKFMQNNGLNPIMFDDYPRFIGYSLASGTSERGTKHMVILFNGMLYHDPHPSRVGLKETDTVWLIKTIT